MSRAVAALEFPHSAIPAMAAIRHVRRLEGEDPRAPVDLIAVEGARRGESAELLRQLLTPFPEARLWVPTDAEYDRYFRRARPVRARAADLRRRFGEDVTQVHYSHDVHLSFIPQSLMWAWPDARRVCFGDAMGVVYSLRTYLRTMLGTRRRIWDTFRVAVARAIGFLPPRLEAEIACLILPSDPGGDFLRGKRLAVPPVAEVRDVLDAMSGACADLLALAPREPRWLLLLSNFSGNRLASPDAEIAIYREILERHVPHGESVILKPHPGSSPAFVESLVYALSPLWQVHPLDRRLLLLPAELASDLVSRCTVLSLSFTTVSLPYLRGARVVHALDDALIERWILPEKRRWVKQGNDEYVAMAARLASWDGRSPL